MLRAVLTSIVSFVSTNIDDIFVLMLLYVQADTRRARRKILAGQYLGSAVLMAVCLLGAFGVGLIPAKYTRLLGLVPIFLGLRAWRHRGDADDGDQPPREPGLAGVALLALANGADNIGIYVPLFTGCTPGELAAFLAVYALLLPLWCRLARALTGLPLLGERIRQWKSVLVPVVFLLLGVYILLRG